MKDYNLKILETTRDPKKFVKSWKYVIKTHYDMIKYKELKKKDPTQKRDLKKILKWKNGGRLFDSHKTYCNSLLREWKKWSKKAIVEDHFSKVQFVSFLKSRSHHGVFDTFLLNLLSPKKYPIIDRHTYKAFCSLKGLEDVKLSSSKNRFQEQYEKYTNFFNELVKDSKCQRKDVDNALWGYGKFLSLYNKKEFET